MAAGHPPAIRQVTRGVDQATQIQQLFVDMVAGAAPGNPTLRDELQERGARPPTPTVNSPTCCATRSRRTPGHRRVRARRLPAVLPGVPRRNSGPDETYQWGMQRWKALLPNRSRSLSGCIPARRWPGRCAPGLEPRYIVHGTDALQAWMQDLSDRAVESLADKHFDIAPPLRRLECRIAPTQTGGIYYTGPRRI